MKSVIYDMFGVEFPLFAFGHCRDVVAAVSRAGGFGVLGAVRHSPDTLDIELSWIDENVNGRPYGVDLIVPAGLDTEDGAIATQELQDRVPPEHRAYVDQLLAKHDVDTKGLWDDELSGNYGESIRKEGASRLMDVAFTHPIKLLVNALGEPPDFMLQRASAEGVAVGALAGAPEHALKHGQAGADILIVSGTEGGGHCGEVSTMVLVPEVIESLRSRGDVPILAAGGIVTGRQMAACMAMGAAGVWTGSVWLTTTEGEATPVVKQKMLLASSRQTIRSRSRTGKYTRQLRSAWTDAWESEESPEPLPMPLQGLVSGPPLARLDKLAEGGDPAAKLLATYYVGQGVGLMNSTRSATSVVYDFMEDYASAVERLMGTIDDS